MNTPKSESPKVQYRPSEDLAEFYANNMRFQGSLWDMKIFFGELDQTTEPNTVLQHSAITIPWAQVKIMIYFLQMHLMWYEGGQGRIAIPRGVIPEFAKEPPKGFIQQFPKPENAEKYWAQARKHYEQFLAANPEAQP